MGARYGRNQRRRHRERIAQLEAVYGGWTSTADYPVVGKIPEGFIIEIEDETTERRGEGRIRVAYVTLFADTRVERLLAPAYRQNTRLEWRETSWKVDEVRYKEAAGSVIAKVRLSTWAGRTLGRVN